MSRSAVTWERMRAQRKVVFYRPELETGLLAHRFDIVELDTVA